MNPRNLTVIAVGCAALVAIYAFLDTSPASSPGASQAAPLTAPQQAIGDASTDIAPQPAAEQPLAESAPVDADTSGASPEASSGQAQAQQQHQAHTVASQRFKALSKPEQYSERKTALAKLIAGDELALGNQVALSERSYSRREKIKRSKDLAESQIDVNGMRLDVAQKGTLVDNRLAVYVTTENRRMIDDLRGMAGVRAVKAVFPGKLDAVRNTPRDPSGWYHIELAASKERIPAMVKALNSFPEVGVAEAAFERRIKLDGALISDLDDPLKADQWHLTAVQVPAAWEHLQANDLPAGGLGLTVAVIDTGVDYLHPDLVDNMWVNPLEVPGNGMDDDDNGFIDDIHGVAVVSESFSHSGDPNDDHGHGTHVAGIIAATGGNDIGGVGIAYNARIMAIKAAQYSGVLTTVDIAEAILYAVDNGADIINMSFGGYGRSLLEEDALAIAYSQAVLVAAAGNNGKPNQTNCRGAPMYPAAHPWVLGVMARTEQPNAEGDYIAGFSNWDCKADNGLEYELMAPGTAIWSTLPGDGYGAWSGTSMAAPVVAGIAALARTKWPDKSVYSSRFIMGQAAATGPALQAFTPLNKPPVSYREANAFNAVTTSPAPALSYEEHWLFDETTRSDANDSDGRIDSGETVELAIVIRNRWGKADNVVATLSTPSGASSADPYVSFVTDSVNYGAVGSFNQDDNGLIYDDDLLVVGVNEPFVLTVAEDTPNNHIIPFTLTMTAENGLDPEDATNYSFESSFSLVVQRGRELPSIIDGDAAGTDGGNVDTDGVEDGIVTLDAAALWIIDKPVLVVRGTTVKVTEGAQLQFWSSLPDEAYTVWRNPYIQVEGTLDIEGTATNPVTIFPSALFPTRVVQILKGNVQAVINLNYSKVTNLVFREHETWPWDTVNYNLFDRYYPGESLRGGNTWATGANELTYRPRVDIPWVSCIDSNCKDGSAIGNRFYKLGYEYPYTQDSDSFRRSYMFDLPQDHNMSLLDGNHMIVSGPSKGSVYLKNRKTYFNYNGEKVYRGSLFENISTTLDYVVVEPFSYDGKTYAVFYIAGGNQNFSAEKIASAKAYARQLGGTLMTVSSQAEMNAVNNWLYDMEIQPSSYWEATYAVCEPTTDDDTFCQSTLGAGHYVIGLIRQSDGTYAWDGDDAGYGDTFLRTQAYWDRVQYATDVGWAVSNDDINWELWTSAILMKSSSPSSTGDLSSYLIDYVNGYEWADSIFRDYGRRFIVELPGTLSQADLDAGLTAFKSSDTSASSFVNNAILNVWHDLDPKHWGTILALSGDASRRFDMTTDVSNNFWGGAGDALVDISVTDFSDDFNLATVKYKPTLAVAPITAYPFVVKAEVTDGDGVVPSGNRFGSQASIWTVTFNRDMDTTKQPLVTFGPDVPFTDFSIPGDWVDARTWQGSFSFNAITGDGWQNIRIAGAVAADNPWLVTGDDSERFRFELITSGTEALSLQASGERDQVVLSWTQDDFELLHGYNLYRAMQEDGQYQRINSSTINKTQSSFVDQNVAPGEPHYYYFTVVSDGGESDPSNLALGTPVDTIAPVISHQAETVALLEQNLTIRAEVTDNVVVSSVTLVFRSEGDTDWRRQDMIEVEASHYSSTIDGTLISELSLEYYIEARDTENLVTFASDVAPQKVIVSLPSELDSDGDGISNGADAFPLDPSETADLDADGIGDNSDTDRDGDGVDNLTDLFPDDSAESLDADADGIGNNYDDDDDNDGTLDSSDRFPFDSRGHSDSDNDGMADEWETARGLDPANGLDAELDPDRDGINNLAEFNGETDPSQSDGPAQIVDIIGGTTLIENSANKLSLNYDVSDGNANLSGLGIRLHFSSAVVDTVDFDNVLAVNLLALDNIARQDYYDFDNDWRTDSYVAAAWASTAAGSGAMWPGSLPRKLLDVTLNLKAGLAGTQEMPLKLSASDTSVGYRFSGEPVYSRIIADNLDIDGDQEIRPLSDGLLILRYLFEFRATALTEGAVDPSGTRTDHSEIESHLEGLMPLLDIDGDGQQAPLSDGLLLLRYMFGFTGVALIEDAVEADATRNTAAAIEAYLSDLIPPPQG